MPSLIVPGSPGFGVLCLCAGLVLVNLAAFVAFRTDKRRAVRGEWRFPERTLLLLAFLGGWPGAKLAQRRFRHKTRKQPFASILNAVPLVWVALAGLAMLVESRGAAGPVAEGISGLSRPTGWGTTELPRRFGPGGDGADAVARPTDRALPRRFGPGSEGG